MNDKLYAAPQTTLEPSPRPRQRRRIWPSRSHLSDALLVLFMEERFRVHHTMADATVVHT